MTVVILKYSIQEIIRKERKLFVEEKHLRDRKSKKAFGDTW